jgi:Tfp pilus assembly protein FimT
MNGLKILNNIIFQETLTISTQQPHTAIHLGSIDNVTINGNTIYNFNGEAVYIESRSPEQGMSGTIISDNIIRNVGLTSTQNRKRAIAFNSYQTSSGSIKDMLVQNNSISGGEKSPIHNGITFNNGYFKNVKISRNGIWNTSSYEIVNNSTGRVENFHIDHAGNGPPVNTLRASSGSRWVDGATGRIYIYHEDYGQGQWQ